MRYLVLLCALTVCMGSGLCSCASPKIEFEKTTIYAGDVSPGSQVSAVFVFKNVGDEDLEIKGVDKSCDCTVARADSSNMKPGESSKLKLTFSAPVQGGDVSKTIAVVTNDPAKEATRLEVTANVIAIAKCDPQRLNFGTVKPRDIIEKTVTVTPANANGFKIESVKCAGTCASVSELRSLEDGKGSYSLKVVIKAGDTVGRVFELVRIKTNVPGAEVSFIVFGNVVK